MTARCSSVASTAQLVVGPAPMVRWSLCPTCLRQSRVLVRLKLWSVARCGACGRSLGLALLPVRLLRRDEVEVTLD